MAVLIPRKTKFRKTMKGKNDGVATRGNTVAFGEYGLMSMDNNDVTSRQIESARQAMTRHVKRGGKIWIRIFPHTPITRKPQDVKMGGGKGDPQFWAAKVKAGTVMFEMAGVSEDVAKEAMRLAGHKLPVRTKFIKAGRPKMADSAKLDLTKQLEEKRKELVEAKRGHRAGELQNPRALAKTRKEIARLLTQMNTKETTKEGEE